MAPAATLLSTCPKEVFRKQFYAEKAKFFQTWPEPSSDFWRLIFRQGCQKVNLCVRIMNVLRKQTFWELQFFFVFVFGICALNLSLFGKSFRQFCQNCIPSEQTIFYTKKHTLLKKIIFTLVFWFQATKVVLWEKNSASSRKLPPTCPEKHFEFLFWTCTDLQKLL